MYGWILKSRLAWTGAAVIALHCATADALPADRQAVAEAMVTNSAVDLRPNLERWGLERRSQGDRGTCSVFTVTGAMEYALASRRGRGTELSVEFLNWASNDITGEANDGGFFSDLWKGFVRHGICTEGEFPYRAAFDAGLRPSDRAFDRARGLRAVGFQLHWIKPWDVTTGLTDAEFATIKATLRRQWPVCGGFRWPKDVKWNDGVLEMAPPEGVYDGHSVLLVGYRDDPDQPGGGVFLIRNSGRGLADAAMSYEYVRAYMNDALWIDCGP